MTSAIVTQQVKDTKAHIAKLKRPADISKLVWSRIKKLLGAIAEHLPHPYPGMRRLAKRLGCSPSTVSTHVRLAEEAGLLTRTSRGGCRDGMDYVLTCAVPACSSAHKEESPSGTRPPSSKEDSVVAGRVRRADFSGRRRNRYPGECCVCGGHLFAQAGFLHGRLPVHEGCDTGAMGSKWKDDPDNPDNWSRGEAEFGERPEAPKVTKLVTDPAVRLARTFENLWISTALKNHELQGMRVIDIGPAVGYLRKKMLTHMSPEHIEAYIEAFVEDTKNGEVAFKEGQSAWARFTGWWGTTEVPDPSIRKAQADERRRVKEMIARGEGIVRSSVDETYGTRLRSVSSLSRSRWGLMGPGLFRG